MPVNTYDWHLYNIVVLALITHELPPKIGSNLI